jgi:hypothetical protein
MTAAIIHAYARPLVGTAPVANLPPPTPPALPTLKDLTVTASFNIPLAEGGYITTPSQPVTPGSVITITPNDGRLAVVAGAYVRGPAAWTTGGTTAFTITEKYTGAGGASVTRVSTATITAVAPVVVPPAPTLAQVADAIGVYTRAGVKIAQTPAGSSLTGTNVDHVAVDALGQVTVSNAGQSAGLAASYNLTVVGGGSINTLSFTTLPNTWTATTAAEIEAAFNVAKLITNRDGRIALPTGTVITSPAVNVSAAGTAPANVIWRRYIELKGAKMAGTIVDANKNLTPQDVDPKGFTPLVGGVFGHGQYAGLNGKQAYQWDATASVSGGSITIYCPTTLDTVSGKTGGATMTAMVYAEDCWPLRFENVDFNLMSSVDMYDSKVTAPTYVTREAVISVTKVTAAGGVAEVSFDDAGAGYAPGRVWDVGIDTKTAAGGNGRFAATAKTKGDGTIDPATFFIKASGSGYTTSSKLKVYELRVWDPPQLTDAPQFPAYNPVTKAFGKFYQFIGSSREARQEGTTPNDYCSFVFSKCRFGIGGRSDRTSLRVNRCINITSAHNHLLVEDCLFDYMWIGIGHAKWCRTELRRNSFVNYTNDIIDTYPTTALIDPVKTAEARAINPSAPAVPYDDLPSGLRAEALMIVTDNYIGKPEQTSLLMSNSHSDGHQHGAGGDKQKQNILYAHNILNMNATSTYMVTQGYFDNGNSEAPKRAKVKYNFSCVSSTNALNFSYTGASEPEATLFECNFATRSVYSAVDFGSGVDAIGGGINPMGVVEVATLRRNTIKEVWDMGPGNGGRIAFNPSTGIMMANPSSIPSQTTTVPRINKLTNQPVGPIYISDNFFLSYLTPNTGAGNSYPEIFKDKNAAGQGPCFIWNPALGISGPGAGQYSIGFHRWWEKVRDTPASGSWTDTWAAMRRAQADIQSIFTPLAGSGADGRHPFPAEVF